MKSFGILYVFALCVIIPTSCIIIEHPSNFDENEFYDFVIVGGGSAGCVVANRLSENPNWKVLLLEAGTDEKLDYGIPGVPSFFRPEINWGYSTAPNNYSCLSRIGKSCPVPRGKVLGGCSTINFMIYFRGNQMDYDEWSELGNEGWSYDEVLPYFKKSEDNGNSDIASNKKYHSIGGYQHVERWNYEDRNLNRIINGFNEIGLKKLDLNGQTNSAGVMVTQFTQKNNTRMSTNKAFLNPVKNRKNLKVMINAYVTKLIIEPFSKSALGVEVANGKNKIKIWAKKEVIVSAGAVNSPKLLMLSGVGPRKILEPLNIPVIKDASVGENYYDHVTFGGLAFNIDNLHSTHKPEDDIKDDLKQWYYDRTGPIGSMGPIAVGAFVNTKDISGNNPPDIQYILDGLYLEGNPNITALISNFSQFYSLPYYNSFNIKPILLRPKSVGTIHLDPNDPTFGKPILNSNFLEQEEDLEPLVDAVEIALKLLDTDAFKSMGARRIQFGGGFCDELDGRDYWKCLIRQFTSTIYHPLGTCKMGPRNDETAVVDHRLKVHGIERLRVIDASIMPKAVRSNTNAPVIMIGEKGSQMIKDDWGKYN